MRREDVTEEIRKRLQFENRGVGLEDGDFYDGSCFRNNCGTMLPCHPSKIFFWNVLISSELEQFIDAFLEERNKEILKKNEKMEKETKLIEESFRLF